MYVSYETQSYTPARAGESAEWRMAANTPYPVGAGRFHHLIEKAHGPKMTAPLAATFRRGRSFRL